LLGSEHSEGLSELLGKSEKSSFLKEERSMFHYPAAHMETVGGKGAEDSSTLTENSSQRFFFWTGSGFWAAPICATKLWVSVSNTEALDLCGLIQDVLPVLLTELSSQKCLPLSMPLLYTERMKS